MALSDELNSARAKLFDKLGELTKPYCLLMKQWFSYKMTKETFDFEVRKIMNPEQTRLHNDFLLQLLNKCAFANFSEKNRVNGKKLKSAKQKRSSDKGGFQPADPVKFLPHQHQSSTSQAPPPKLQEDAQRYSVQDYFLPDHSFILGRLMLGAWEIGMKGADDNAAECLVIAVQYFLKNVLTAVITMRKGYKVRENRLIESIGDPVPNSWIRNIKKNRSSVTLGRMDTFEDNEDVNMMLEVQARNNDREQTQAFNLACAPIPAASPAQQPINAYDLYRALLVHKSTIPAHSMYSDIMERIILCLNHPTWEEMDAAKYFDSY